MAGKAVSAVDEVSMEETNEEHASGIALAQIAGNSGVGTLAVRVQDGAASAKEAALAVDAVSAVETRGELASVTSVVQVSGNSGLGPGS